VDFELVLRRPIETAPLLGMSEFQQNEARTTFKT
jgi:hypothetical protein